MSFEMVVDEISKEMDVPLFARDVVKKYNSTYADLVTVGNGLNINDYGFLYYEEDYKGFMMFCSYTGKHPSLEDDDVLTLSLARVRQHITRLDNYDNILFLDNRVRG